MSRDPDLGISIGCMGEVRHTKYVEDGSHPDNAITLSLFFNISARS